LYARLTQVHGAAAGRRRAAAVLLPGHHPTIG
jgi:hypothetical protein